MSMKSVQLDFRGKFLLTFNNNNYFDYQTFDIKHKYIISVWLNVLKLS